MTLKKLAIKMAEVHRQLQDANTQNDLAGLKYGELFVWIGLRLVNIARQDNQRRGIVLARMRKHFPEFASQFENHWLPERP